MKSSQSTSDTSGIRITDTAWLKMIWPYLMEFRGRVMLAAICLIGAKLASVSMPFVLKHLVDGLSSDGTHVSPWVWMPLGLLLAYGSVRFMTVLLGEVRDLIFGRVTEHAMRRMALKVFSHLHSLSLDFHLSRQTGGLQRDIERGTNGISFLMRFIVFNILPTFLELFLVVGLLLINYPPWFALITLVAVISYVVFTARLTEWRTHYVREVNKMDSQTHSRALDSLMNYETVKYYSAEEKEARSYDHSLAQWEKARRSNRVTLFNLNAGQALIISVAMTLMLTLSAWYVIKGEMTIGDFTLMNAFMFQLFLPLSFLGFVYREVKASLAGIERMTTLLDEKSSVRDEGKNTLVPTGGDIRFSQVGFSYVPERAVLRSVSFHIPSGKKTAVVGGSGAGKSTITRLLFRFYEADSGSIMIDGQDIRSLSLKSLRHVIGVVPQDTVLFNDTLRSNLLYADENATDEQLKEILSMVQLSGFLEQCPEGLDTVVGERGLKLSGGEKQRISIARMLLKKPAVMVFDEATSSLDSVTESQIMKSIHAVSEGHTSLIIAHRLSTIMDVDNILVLKDGEVAESGSHEALLKAEGEYYRLWQAQQNALTDH